MIQIIFQFEPNTCFLCLFHSGVYCCRRESSYPKLFITINWPSGADQLWPVSLALQLFFLLRDYSHWPSQLLDKWFESGFFMCNCTNATKAFSFKLLLSVTFCVFPPSFFTAAYLNIGIIQVSQGNIEEAKRTFLSCADIPDENLKDPHAHKSSVTSCLYNLGKLLHEQGHHEVCCASVWLFVNIEMWINLVIFSPYKRSID